MIEGILQTVANPVVAGSITSISLLVAAYSLFRQGRSEKENATLRREAVTISWDDLILSADDLAHQIRTAKGRNWKPDYVFSFSSRGGIIGEMIIARLCPGTPQLIGVSIHKGDCPSSDEISGYHKVETLKWNLYIPISISLFRNARILLVDDYVQSGTDIRALIKLLESTGHKPVELVTCAVVKAASAVSLTDCVPDFFWSERADHRFFWPWGVAR